MASDLATSPETSAASDRLQLRLRRVEGQIRGIQRMIEQNRECDEVLTQIAAAEAALDQVALGLIGDHARRRILTARPRRRAEQADELMDAVARLMRHR